MSEVEKVVDVFCEYRSIIRELAIKAKKEEWSEDKLQFEIENVSNKVDKIINAFQVRKEFFQDKF